MSSKHPPAHSPVTQNQRKKIKTGGASGLELAPEMDTTDNTQPQDKILQLLEKMSLDINTINERFLTLERKYNDVTTTLNAAEDRISTLEDRLGSLTAENTKLAATLDSALSKLSDIENRSRRCNLRVFGFPEGCDQGRPTEFLERELPRMLDMQPGSIEIERAHRSLNPRPLMGQKPRPYIIKLLRYPIKEKVLTISREKKELRWGPENVKIMIFQDFTKDVVDKRLKFAEAKRMAKNKNFNYFMTYPAVLKIRMRDGLHTFASHEAAEHFISTC